MAFSKLVVVALSATLFARANVPLQCKDYEAQIIKTAADTLGETIYGEQAKNDIDAPNAISTLNAWTDPDWPGQNNPAPPASTEYVSPAQKEIAYWKEVGTLKPQPSSSSFLQKSNVVYYRGRRGSNETEVKPKIKATVETTEPFPMPGKAEVDYALSKKAADLNSAAEAGKKAAEEHVKEFKCLADRKNAKKALAILKDTLEACSTGVSTAQSKGSETCAESCSRNYPEKECDNVYFAACVKGCSGFSENYPNAEKTFLENAGAHLAIKAKSGDTMPASIPTNENTPDFITGFPGGGVDQGESSN